MCFEKDGTQDERGINTGNAKRRQGHFPKRQETYFRFIKSASIHETRNATGPSVLQTSRAWSLVFVNGLDEESRGINTCRNRHRGLSPYHPSASQPRARRW